jgi:hypothetical protein
MTRKNNLNFVRRPFAVARKATPEARTSGAPGGLGHARANPQAARLINDKRYFSSRCVTLMSLVQKIGYSLSKN